MQAQTVLVVGGAGYIGSHVCKALHAAGVRPVTFDNLSTGHEHAVRWGPLVTGDVRNQADLGRAFSEYAPDAVMHFAANVDIDHGQRDPLSFWENNVGGVLSLLSAMRRYAVSNLVFSSSCAVYGRPSISPITENAARQPINVYGRTKLAAEQILSDAASAYGLKYAALRYFNAAGASPDGDIGEEHEPESHLIPNALKAAAGMGERLSVFGVDYDTPDGTCIRDYIHVTDLADAHVAALENLRLGAQELIVNLGTGGGVSVWEVLEAVERVVGSRPPHDLKPRRAGDAPVLTADISLAQQILGFKPKRSAIDTIIADAWRFHRRVWEP